MKITKILVGNSINTHLISLNTDVAIIILFIIAFVLIYKHKRKWYIVSKPQINTNNVSSEKNGPFLQISTAN